MRAVYIAPLFTLLSACGSSGSSGGGGGSSMLPPLPTSDASLGGLWEGSLTYQDQTFEDLVGFTTADGRLTLISLDTFGPDTVAQYMGMISVDGETFSGSGTAYAELGATWDSGATVLGFTVMGTIIERATITGSFQLDGGESVDFDLAYDPVYEEDSSLALLEGVWSVYNDLLNPVTTFTVEAGGQFSAQSATGCASLGQVAIIDALYNLYQWTVTISNCGIAGDYTGFAVLDSLSPAIVVNISNDQRALVFFLEP